MKLIKWKYIKSVNTYEGTVKGDIEPLISIQGGLCVTDLRECKKSKEWISPKHYKVIGLSIEERKQLAEDLVTGNNFEKHEQNKLDWIAKNEQTVKVIQEAEEFLKKLQNDKNN